MSSLDTARELTIRWEDPRGAIERGRQMSGAEYMRALIGGEFPPPPIAALMGFLLIEVGEGTATFRGEPGEQHLNPDRQRARGLRGHAARLGAWVRRALDFASGRGLHDA